MTVFIDVSISEKSSEGEAVFTIERAGNNKTRERILLFYRTEALAGHNHPDRGRAGAIWIIADPRSFRKLARQRPPYAEPPPESFRSR